MDAGLLTWLPIGLVVLIVLLFVALRLWAASKQRTLSAEEFRHWFQKNMLGMAPDSPVQPSTEDSPARTRKDQQQSG